MNARRKTFLPAIVITFAGFSGGCSRLTPMFVHNQCPFTVSIYERVQWQSTASTKDSGPILPQGVFPALSLSRGESVYLVVTNAAGTVLSRGSVTEETVNAAYWKHKDISIDVMPDHIRVNLENVDFANASNTWRTFGLVAAGLAVLLIAFRFCQKQI